MTAVVIVAAAIATVGLTCRLIVFPDGWEMEVDQ